MPNAGTGVVRIDVVGDGEAFYARGRGGGAAMRLPRLNSHTTEAPAILRVRNATERDALSPGTSPFRFGAVVKVFARSTAGWRDNGDNLVQRGLYDDPTQYKIGLDRGRPSCRVKGSVGVVEVTGALRLKPHRWYRVVCTRVGPQVSLVVRDLSGRAHAGLKGVFWDVGEIGTVAYTDPRVPLSIGGKIGMNGLPEPASDQLNGLIDRAFVRFSSPGPVPDR